MLIKAREFLLSVLIFLRVVDEHDRMLSISNIALIISLYKLATTHDASYTDIGAVMVTLSNYGFKKYINKDSVNTAQKVVNAVLTKSEEISS